MKLLFYFCVYLCTMQCKNIQKYIDSLLTNDLSEEEIKQMKSHLKSCSACRELKNSFDNSWSALDLWEDKEPPSQLKNTILRIISYEEEKKKRSFMIRYALSAVAMAFIVFTLIFSFTHIREFLPDEDVIIEGSPQGEIIIKGHKVSSEELLMDLPQEEIEFLEQVDVMSHLEYLYLMESQEKPLEK